MRRVGLCRFSFIGHACRAMLVLVVSGSADRLLAQEVGGVAIVRDAVKLKSENASDLMLLPGASVEVIGKSDGQLRVVSSWLCPLQRDGSAKGPVPRRSDPVGTIPASAALAPEAAVEYFTGLIDKGPKNESALLARGVAHYHAEDAKGAIEDCDRAVEVAKGGSTTALLCRGQILLGLERYADAERDFSRVLDVTPESLLALYWRIQAFKFQDDYQRAILDCGAAMKLDSESAGPWISRAYFYCKQNQLTRARKDIQNALNKQKNTREIAFAWLVQALVELSAGDMQKAISNLSDGISAAPDLPDHINRHPCREADASTRPLHDKAYLLALRALLQLQVGRYGMASDDCTSAIEIEPTYKLAFTTRAMSRIARAEYEMCVADLTEALRIAPNDYRTLTNRGACWLQLGKYREAITDCSAAIKLRPDECVGYNNRGAAWYALGEDDKAIKDYSAAIGLDPKCEKSYCGRAMAELDSGQYRQSALDYSEAIQLNPQCDSYYASRADAWLRAKEFDKALADCSQAIQLNPDCQFAYWVRAAVWIKAHNYDKAIADLDREIELDPQSTLGFCMRGTMWLAKGEFVKGMADLERSVQLDATNVIYVSTLAWWLAVCPDNTIRDGKRAVELATKACELSKWKDTNALEVLAAACAETRDFDAAVKWERKAMEQVDESQREPHQERLKLYEAGKPFRTVNGAEESYDIYIKLR